MRLTRWKFRTLFWSGTGLVFVFLLVWAFWPQPVRVDMVVATQGPMTVVIRDEGRTRIHDVFSVTAPLAGRLLRLEREAGDLVQAGEVVARILPLDPTLLDTRTEATAEALARSAEAALSFAEAELARSQSQLEYARIEAARNEALLAIDGVAESTVARARLEARTADAAVDTARANVRMRQAELEAARARLLAPGMADVEAEEVVEIRSPISGSVLRVLQESESVVGAGAALLEIGDSASLEIVLELLSTDAVRVTEGARVAIERWGGELPLAGVVRRVEPFGFVKISALGVEEQRVNVIVDFTDRPETWAALGHGFRVEGAIVIWEGENIVQVPVAALFRNDGGWAVFRVENGRAVLSPLEIGQNNGETAEIFSGINPGDTLVLYPGQEVADGVRVAPR